MLASKETNGRKEIKFILKNGNTLSFEFDTIEKFLLIEQIFEEENNSYPDRNEFIEHLTTITKVINV